jgi:hypothetical protein
MTAWGNAPGILTDRKQALKARFNAPIRSPRRVFHPSHWDLVLGVVWGLGFVSEFSSWNLIQYPVKQ